MTISKLALFLLATTSPLPSAGFHPWIPSSHNSNSNNNVVDQSRWKQPFYYSLSLSKQRWHRHHATMTLFSTTSQDDTHMETDLNGDWEEEHHHQDNEDMDENEYDEEGDNLSEEIDDYDYEEEEEEEDGEEDEKVDPLTQECQQWTNAIQDALKALAQKETSLENERSKAQKLEETVARAQLIVNNLYLFHAKESMYRVVDWEQDGKEVDIELDPQYESASAEADALFAQARKLKRGSKVIQELLEQVEQSRQVLEDCLTDLQFPDGTVEKGRLQLVQDRLRRTAASTQFKEPKGQDNENRRKRESNNNNNNNNNRKPALGSPASNVRRLVTPAGATVLVGRNRRGNEYLSLTYARGNDVWMHARGTPGAHVLVLDRRGSVRPTQECLEFAAHLAAFYSDARTESKVPVTLAEPKHVVKPRGAPLGAVKLRQEGQVLYGCPELVPVDLQEARAQSGVYASEEYRSADKAKHRKFTKRVQQEKQKQKQEQRRNKRKRNAKSESDDE